MKRNIFQSLGRTVIAAIVTLVITTTVTVAEIPRNTVAVLQNRSPDKLLIEVNHRGPFAFQAGISGDFDQRRRVFRVSRLTRPPD